MTRLPALVLLAAFALAGPAAAEVVDSQAGGFTVRESEVIAASPQAVWDVMVQPGSWWSSEHTYSGDARNLSLTVKPGGFWQETLPAGGGARHMVVVLVKPPTMLRLEGALGPLQAMGVAGHLTFSLKPEDKGTLVTETYDAGGHAPGGLDKLAAPVDGVLGQQLARLKTRVETGKTP